MVAGALINLKAVSVYVRISRKEEGSDVLYSPVLRHLK